MITSILYILLIVLVFGLPLSFLIVPKHNIAGRIGLSYLVGLGVFTLIMYLTNLLGLKLTFINNLLTLIAISTPLIIFQRDKVKHFWLEIKKTIDNLHLDIAEKIMVGGISYFIISSFVSTLYWPVYIWDALTLYDFRAHVFIQTGYIKQALDQLGSSYYFGYPLLTSLSHTIVYLSGGSNPQFLYSMFYLSLALVFYGLLRDLVSRKFSLLFTLMLVSIPRIFSQSIVSYTNLPYLSYFSVGVIYFYIWNKKHLQGYLVLSSLLVGLSVWTRSIEPLWLVVLLIAISIFLRRKRFGEIALFATPLALILLAWNTFQGSNGSIISIASRISGSSFNILSFFDFSKLSEVFAFLFNNVVCSWGGFFAIFIIASLVACIYRLEEGSLLIWITVCLMVFLGLGTFVFSYIVPNWLEIPDSAIRVAMFFYPLSLYILAIVMSKTYK